MLKLALFLCTLAFSANAQTITSLTTYFNAQCPDNNQRLCTPANVRNIGLAFPNNIFVSSSNPITTTSYVSASTYYGDGSNLTGISATAGSVAWGNIIGTPPGVTNVSDATGSVTATTFTGTNLGGTLTTAAQPNITSVGTLTGLTVSGIVTASFFEGDGSRLTNVPTSGTPQSIVSGTTRVDARSDGTISLTTGGVVTGYFDTTGRLVIPGVSSSGIVTATFFEGNGSRLTGVSGAGTLISTTTFTNPSNISESTSIGFNAGVGTGTSNTTYGTSAGSALTTGVANVAIGSSALSRNTTGGSNVAIGARAAASCVTCSSVTAVGFDALRFAISGANTNSAFGSQALQSETVGTGNTAVGNAALSNHNGGNSNVALGSNAGAALVSGSSNITIGTSANLFATSGSFQLNVGNSVWGNIGSGTGNSNLIGINVTSPTVALQVSGTVSATAFTGNGSGLTNLPAGSAAGPTQSVQYNSGTAFAGSSAFTVASGTTTVALSISGTISATQAINTVAVSANTVTSGIVSATQALYSTSISNSGGLLTATVSSTGTVSASDLFSNYMREGVLTTNATTATTALNLGVATMISGTIASTTTVSFNNANFTQANVVVWKPCWTLGGATITWPATARFNNNTSPTVVTTNATCSLFTLTPLPGSSNILVTMPATGVSN